MFIYLILKEYYMNNTSTNCRSIAYLQSADGNVYLTDSRNVITLNINPGCYILSRNPMPPKEFFLKPRNLVSPLPEDLISLKVNIDRIVNSFEKSSSNMGVLLEGFKGMGKTKTVMGVVYELQNKYPVIFIEDSVPMGSEFNEFIHAFGPKVVIVVDEFDRLFSPKPDSDSSQHKWLSFLDGSASTGDQIVLTLLTTNSTDSLISPLLGRTGRIRYRFKHTKMQPPELITYLKNRDYPDSIINNIKGTWATSKLFNWDILHAILKEINEYPNLSYDECIKILNTDQMDFIGKDVPTELVITKVSVDYKYSYSIGRYGKEGMSDFSEMIGKSFQNPLYNSSSNDIRINFTRLDLQDDDEYKKDHYTITISSNTVIEYRPSSNSWYGSYVFSDEGLLVEMEERPVSIINSLKRT